MPDSSRCRENSASTDPGAVQLHPALPVTAVETGNDNPNVVPTSNGVPNGVPNAVTRCPHCSKPVAVISLLVAPAAAHIATPASADA